MKPFRNGISQLKHIFWTFSFENNQIKSSQSLCRRGSKKYNELQIQWIPNDNKRTEISMKNNLFEINWFETAKWTNERKKKTIWNYINHVVSTYPHSQQLDTLFFHVCPKWISRPQPHFTLSPEPKMKIRFEMHRMIASFADRRGLVFQFSIWNHR